MVSIYWYSIFNSIICLAQKQWPRDERITKQNKSLRVKRMWVLQQEMKGKCECCRELVWLSEDVMWCVLYRCDVSCTITGPSGANMTPQGTLYCLNPAIPWTEHKRGGGNDTSATHFSVWYDAQWQDLGVLVFDTMHSDRTLGNVQNFSVILLQKVKYKMVALKKI
jgi:hypothetical protein